MRRPSSLRGRLALTAVLVSAVFLGALAIAFNLVLAAQLRGGADELLHTRAEATAATIDVLPAGGLTLEAPVTDRAVAGSTWVYAGRRALARAPGDRAQQDQADALAGVGQRTEQSREPEAVRYLALPVLDGRRQVGTVVSSVSLDPYERVAKVALLASVVLTVLALAGAYVLARALVGRALAPVTAMTAQAERWSAVDVERRFGPEPRPVELRSLAGSLDGVLDHLTSVLRHEQQLSAELSHELRTPLASLLAEVELVQQRPRTERELADAHHAIRASAERMSRVLESLLTAARAVAGPDAGRCEVARAVRGAVTAMGPGAPVSVRERTTHLLAGVDDALLERALSPVLDNAVRFCQEQVQVVVDADRDGPFVLVSDDGPGVEPVLVDSLFEPGVSSGGGHGGAGLGLALARRLARAGGGDLRLAPGPGGARFLLRLPAA